MNIRLQLIVGLLGATVSLAQPNPPPGTIPTPPPVANDFNARVSKIIQASAVPAPTLAKFSLDFPGGSPGQLVATIEKAMGRSLNVIIADEQANTRLPALKVTDVTVPQFFTALAKSSYRYDANRNVIGSLGFETDSAPPSEDSIWRFVVYSATQVAPSSLARFDLDFPGGTPKQLAAAIEKATHKPLNVVIPAEHAEVLLPPLKMSDVNVALLFQALSSASRKTVAYSTGGYSMGPTSYQQMITSYGFRSEGPQTDASIWSFYVEKPNLPPVISTARICRFYSLVPYLDQGQTVDDITTAIQTGWKMLGEKDAPTINYHKDTKLLIAVGEPSKLETIDAVLKALQPSLVAGKSTPPPSPAPKFEKKAKTETEN